jgi:multidrug resistance efflux pump
MKQKTFTLLIIFLLILALSACDALNGNTSTDVLTASGFIAADQVRVAPEIGGKVVEILVAEGDSVQPGDVLLRLDDELLQAQLQQAQAAVDLTAVSVDAANAQLTSAQAQYALTVQQARLGDLQNRATAWATATPDEFNTPIWYFEKTEQISAAQAEVDAANQNLETELANLKNELQDASNDDFVAVETRLAQAQIAYRVADITLQQAQAASDKDNIESVAQEEMDAAQAELDAAQLEYDRMLKTSAAQAVLEARARVAVARARLDHALDAVSGLQTGENSLPVDAAKAGVAQAQIAVEQAKANQAQAQAAVNVIELQLKRCVVTAPVAGTVLSLNVETGELVAGGSVALTIGQLDEVNLTVYVPEDQYGQINLGQNVSVAVDSFPGKNFTGQVQAIADEAEFTPRNVQTVEGRKSTVFAVKVNIANPDLALKPGMPADVDFGKP